MTYPTPSPSPTGVHYNGQYAAQHGIPINPDGTPKLDTAAPAPSGSNFTIWDIPSELTDYLSQYSGGKLWFDVGTKKDRVYAEEPHNSAYDSQVPEAARKSASTKLVDINHYDIMRKPDRIMAQFMAMSVNDPMTFLALQKALASGPWGTVNLNGVFDGSTEHALGQAMLQYVKLSVGTSAAMSFTDYLMNMGARAQALGGDGTSLGGGASAAAPQQISLTDPEAIKSAAQSAAEQALGRGLSEGELNKFVSQFQAAQTTYQTSDASRITAPELSSQADAFAQSSAPQEYKQQKHQSYLNALVNMFAPSGSQRPDMGQPVPTA